MGHTVRIVSPPPAQRSIREKLKLWLRGQRELQERDGSASHLDGSGVEHYLLDRNRSVTTSDVPDGDVVIATWWETAEWVHHLESSKGAKVYFIQHHEVFSYLPVVRCEATYRMPLHKVVIANWLQELMKTRYGDEDVDLVPNSVDRTQFFAEIRGKQITPTVGFLYSVTPFKGLDVTLEVLRMVQTRFPGLRIVSFGSNKPSTSYPLPNGAEFHLAPPQHEIRDIYARCDVWLTASRSEGFNLPAIEAMACRTPVVATKTGWPQESIASGVNGILVDVDDVNGLAAGIIWVLDRTNQEWRTLSKNAYATASAGSWEKSAKKFEKALQRAIERTRKGELASQHLFAP
jgi:glycosyltransferase involved in cell wall biosynthesis